MQMVTRPSLRGRFLYYWAKLYSGQLQSGDQYESLESVVSICFVDGRLFPETNAYHLPFGLWDPSTGLAFSDDLAIHLFQLPNFTKTADELTDALDLWLYFLNNGQGLDPENLPARLRVAEVKEAMSVLREVTQDELERARYYDREKARMDALSWEKALERRHAKALAEAQAQALAVGRAAGRAEGRAEALISQVRLCERFLRRLPRPDEQLQALSVEELHRLVDQLRSELDP